MHLAIVLKRGFCEHLTAYRSSLAYRRFARVPDGGPISSHAPCFEQPGRNIKTSVTFSPTSLPLPFFPCLARSRTRPSPGDTLTRLCVRCVCGSCLFPLAPSLGSPGSASGGPELFVGFAATVEGSDFSRLCIIGYGSSPSRCGPPL